MDLSLFSFAKAALPFPSASGQQSLEGKLPESRTSPKPERRAPDPQKPALLGEPGGEQKQLPGTQVPSADLSSHPQKVGRLRHRQAALPRPNTIPKAEPTLPRYQPRSGVGTAWLYLGSFRRGAPGRTQPRGGYPTGGS